MKISYVDVLLRVRVKHDILADPCDIVCAANYNIAYEHQDGDILTTEIKETLLAGTCDSDSNALIRNDGQSGRNASILHDPPV